MSLPDQFKWWHPSIAQYNLIITTFFCFVCLFSFFVFFFYFRSLTSSSSEIVEYPIMKSSKTAWHVSNQGSDSSRSGMPFPAMSFLVCLSAVCSSPCGQVAPLLWKTWKIDVTFSLKIATTHKRKASFYCFPTLESPVRWLWHDFLPQRNCRIPCFL